MLDEAIRLALPGARTACYVEWESYAQACLLARMEEASLEPAPIWGDSLESFPAEQFAGRIDWISAGFPCQPHSLAGRRKGVEDERWIWEAIAEIIRRVGPRFVFLENVRGLLSSSAGAAFGKVLRDLAKIGFDVEWTVLRASDVGAAHQRARLFIMAHRPGERFGKARPSHPGQSRGVSRSGTALADGQGDRWKQRRAEPGRIERRPDAPEYGGKMADASGGLFSQSGRRSQRRDGTGSAGSTLGDANGEREQQSHDTNRTEPRQNARDRPCRASGGLAHPGGTGCERCEFQGPCDYQRHRADASRSTAEFCGPCLFAPGPNSGLWRDILTTSPHLAPAVESNVCMLVDGMALVVDKSRADALRCAGNGVVPLQAAAAFRHLARRTNIVCGIDW